MVSTTRSELISQGYEIEQKLMPLIEQVLEVPSSHCACGFTMYTSCTGTNDYKHSRSRHSPGCWIVHKVPIVAFERLQLSMMFFFLVRSFHPTIVLYLKSNILGKRLVDDCYIVIYSCIAAISNGKVKRCTVSP